MLKGKRILLIVAGGIAAFKSLELIRLLREHDAAVRCVLTEAGAKFVTPLSLQALTEDKVYSDMFSLTDESEMGHIQLSRDADLLVVAPATANILARMAAGLADDLAATVLLATDKPVLAAPAMNVRMWTHAATAANVETLKKRGITLRRPQRWRHGLQRIRPRPHVGAGGDRRRHRSRCWRRATRAVGRQARAGDLGPDARGDRSGALHLQPFLGQAGPCHRRGAGAARRRGHPGERAGRRCRSGRRDGREDRIRPTRCWRPASPPARSTSRSAPPPSPTGRWPSPPAPRSRRRPGAAPPALELTPNPDILATLSKPGPKRPTLVVGFAAETENLVANAIEKRTAQGLRLDRRQRRLARHRHVRRRTQHRAPDQRRGRAGLADAQQGTGRHAAGRRDRAASRPTPAAAEAAE